MRQNSIDSTRSAAPTTDRSARFHTRLSLVLLLAAVALVAWPLIDPPRFVHLAYGAPDGANLLIVAASSGDIDGVRRALDQGVAADATSHGFTALILTDDPAIARLLLSHGANPSASYCHQTP